MEPQFQTFSSYFNMTCAKQRHCHLKLLYLFAERKQLELMVQNFEITKPHDSILRKYCTELISLRDQLALDWMRTLYNTCPDLYNVSSVFFPHLYAAIDEPDVFFKIKENYFTQTRPRELLVQGDHEADRSCSTDAHDCPY